VRDVISDHCVYPQSPLGVSDLSDDPRIKLLPNPCRFSLNDVSFAVTSVDVLFHLRKEQLVMRAEEVESLEVEGQPPASLVGSYWLRWPMDQIDQNLYPPTHLQAHWQTREYTRGY